jgi:RNA recognition motif-containing protein
VYVCNLNVETTEDTLAKFFKDNNFTTKKVKFLLDNNGKSKGAGFVEFHDSAQTNDAVTKLSGKAVDGKQVIVQIAK